MNSSCADTETIPVNVPGFVAALEIYYDHSAPQISDPWSSASEELCQVFTRLRQPGERRPH